MYKAVILPFAKQDIQDAATWYNDKQKGLGKRFTQQVKDKVKFIREYPKAVAIRYDNVRATTLKSFPYMIHYTVDDEQQKVIIYAVLHTRRNPSFWKNDN